MKQKVLLNREHILKGIFSFLLLFIMMFTSYSYGLADENILSFQPKEGLEKVEGVREYTDEEFNAAPIRITVFTTSWCTYCKELKEELPGFIYSKYNNSLVAIRVWDIGSPKALEYFQKIAEKNNIAQEFRGQVPFIFINEGYPYLGYSDEIASQVSEDIKAIFSEMEPPYGGNLEEEKAKNEDIFNKDIKSSIEKGVLNGEEKTYLIKAGILDSFKLIFMLIFSTLFLYVLGKSKNNKYLLFLLFFIGILSLNILTLAFKVPLLLNSGFINVIKLSLYIGTAIIIFEFIVNLVTGNSKGGESGIINILTRVLNSKVMYVIAFSLGFLIMNSQVNSNNINYISLLNSTNSNEVSLQIIISIFIYSLSLISVSGIILLCASIIKDTFFKGRGLKSNM